MVSVLILSHGGLAVELLAAARMIAGELPSFEALALPWTDGIEEAESKVRAVLQRLDQSAGVLILTDIFGGTPSNVAMAFREPGRIEVLSGVNLPMVVRLGCLKSSSMPLSEIAAWIRDKAKTSISCSSELPRPHGRAAPRPPAHRVDDCDEAANQQPEER